MDRSSHFLQLFLAHEADLRAYVATAVRVPALRDDVMQEVALALWKSFDRYDPRRAFGAWARGVATHKVFDHHRRESRRLVLLSPEALEAVRRAFDEEEADGGTAEGDWHGLRIPIEPVLEGEVVKVVGAVELRLPVDRPPGPLLVPHQLPVSELVTTATDFEVIVPAGQTAVFSVNELAEGPHLAMAMTLVTIDPGGQPVETPVPSAATEETGTGGEDTR